MKRPMVWCAVAAVLAAWPVAAQTRGKTAAAAVSKSLADYSEAMENLSEAASPAVVQILVQGVAAVGQGDSKRMGFVSEQEATGSGVIVDPTGYIITNAHVVQNARRISVKVMQVEEKNQTPHGHLLPAKLIGLDAQVDIAVLKIDGTNLPTLPFMNSDTLRQGRLVLALGSPLGLQNTLTHGVVSATLRQLKPESPMVYIQTDAPINPGNSGGPLLDIEGRIVGINTMIYTESGGNEGIGFAIPANLAKDVYEKLRKDGRVRRGAIGVLPDTITPALAAGLGLDRDSGVILSDVAPHGAADAAGLQPGDVVLSIDGKPIKEVRDLALTVFQRAPGDELKIVVLRGKEEITKTVAVLERKNEPSLLADQANYEEALVKELGILAVTVDEKVTAVLPDLRRLSGVAVAAVPTEFAGLNPGLLAGDVIYEVNTKGVASLEELKAMLKEKKPGEPIVLLVERMGQLVYVTATLE
ncbi:MAG: trypsin-like peptidase domain-containing protein [Paludibaculum sp.]